MNRTKFNTQPKRATTITRQTVILHVRRFFAYHPWHYTGYIAMAGLAVGLLVGWVFWPVEWTGATPAELSDFDRSVLLLAVAERYSFDNNVPKVQRDLGSWNGIAYACQLVPHVDPASQIRLLAMVYATGERCK